MSDKENNDLKLIKEYLLGTEFDRKKGLDYRFGKVEKMLNEFQTTQLVMQNQISELQKRKSIAGAFKNLILIFK